MNKNSGNTSVGVRLALGFGGVLCLAALIAIVGWISATSVIDRTAQLKEVEELNSSMTRLTVARLNFIISGGAPKEEENFNKNLLDYKTSFLSIKAKFNQPQNTALIATINDNIDAFEAASKSVFDTMKSIEVERKKAQKAAETLVTSLAAIEQYASEQDLSIAKNVENYRMASRSRFDMSRLRFDVRGFLSKVTPDARQVMEKQLDVVDASFSSLKKGFEGTDRPEANIITSTYADFKGAITFWKDKLAIIDKNQDDLAVMSAKMVEATNQLLNQQYALLSDDSAQSRLTQALAALIASIIASAAAWIIVRQITRPLKNTLVYVEKIAAGDLSGDISVERHDEIGRLQDGIKQMNSSLRGIISGIRDGVDEISNASAQLSTVTAQTSLAANDQKNETDQVATAMHEMSVTVGEVARSAAEASTAATDADQEAQQGKQLVDIAVSQIEKAALEMHASSQAMENLQAESNRIGGILDVIRAVAEQTNLLALNAAIEAARAGDAGRGFAVVADEVRSLAQRTQKSTLEIQELIEKLQAGTKHVATSIQTGRDVTEKSVTMGRKAGDSLVTITEKVSSIQQMNHQIATAAEEQGAVAEEIGRNIVNVRDISERAAATNEETAASSVELARLGKSIHSLVSRFKI